MNKEKFVEEMAKRLSISKAAARKELEVVLDLIQEGTTKDGEVSFMNFGKFVIVERGARKGRNPQTGKEITIPAHKAIAFRVGKAFKNMLK